jgi:hypothetical protein
MLTGTGRQQRDREVDGARREQQVQPPRMLPAHVGRRSGEVVAGCSILVRPPPHQAFLRRSPWRCPAAPRATWSARPCCPCCSDGHHQEPREQRRRPQPGAPQAWPAATTRSPASKDGGHNLEPRRHGRRPPPGAPRANTPPGIHCTPHASPVCKLSGKDQQTSGRFQIEF